MEGQLLAITIPKDTLSVEDSQVVKVKLPTAGGNKNERFTSFRIFSRDTSQSLTRIDISFDGTTDLEDLTAVYILYNYQQKRLSPQTTVLFGKANTAKGIVSVSGQLKLQPGWNYFWITADIAIRAKEGNILEVSALSYSLDDSQKNILPKVNGQRTVLLTHTLVFTGGDFGSRNYRIPAITTGRDGSLITLTDKRWTNPYDLPRHIDVVARTSHDRGKTWSEPVTVAGKEDPKGFGDAALLKNERNGEILALFASGQGFYSSRRGNPIRIFKSISQDQGSSWSSPQDITNSIYGYYCENPITNRWQGAFVSSGRLTQLSNGRIIAALVVRESTSFDISTFVMFSDDQGLSWQVSPNRVASGGNEAKIVELENGELLISIRHRGFRRFSKSYDQGWTWEEPIEHKELLDPSCNGSMIRYSSVKTGAVKNRLLHSLPLSENRENMNVLLSYDEGESWPVKKALYPGPAGYSSLTILKDGSIGLYYECGEYEIYQLYFARFSLNWLSDGEDPLDYALKDQALVKEQINPPQSKLVVYPNPVDDFCRITGEYLSGETIFIYSAAGQIIHSVHITEYSKHVDLSVADFPPGPYWIRHQNQVISLIIQ